MIYKFDILFKKELKGGGTKVVTYNHLLEHPKTFGDGETLEGVLGTLSLTDNEREKGYSLSSLFVKYRSLLVGNYWIEVLEKEVPLQFFFDQPDDVTSIRAELVDENGIHYTSDVVTFIVVGEKTIDLSSNDSFVVLIPQDAGCSMTDIDGDLTLLPGQLAIVPAVCKAVTIQGNCQVNCIKCIHRSV